ncbi:MAG: class II aldolase/adducin family protein [Burkholderiaceae bacterium]
MAWNYDEVCASNLVKIDLEGNIIGHSDYPAGRLRDPFGGAYGRQRCANQCVMHTHTRAGMAVAALEDGLLPILHDLDRLFRPGGSSRL